MVRYRFLLYFLHIPQDRRPLGPVRALKGRKDDHGHEKSISFQTLHTNYTFRTDCSVAQLRKYIREISLADKMTVTLNVYK